MGPWTLSLEHVLGSGPLGGGGAPELVCFPCLYPPSGARLCPELWPQPHPPAGLLLPLAKLGRLCPPVGEGLSILSLGQ